MSVMWAPSGLSITLLRLNPIRPFWPVLRRPIPLQLVRWAQTSLRLWACLTNNIDQPSTRTPLSTRTWVHPQLKPEERHLCSKVSQCWHLRQTTVVFWPPMETLIFNRKCMKWISIIWSVPTVSWAVLRPARRPVIWDEWWPTQVKGWTCDWWARSHLRLFFFRLLNDHTFQCQTQWQSIRDRFMQTTPIPLISVRSIRFPKANHRTIDITQTGIYWFRT